MKIYNSPDGNTLKLNTVGVDEDVDSVLNCIFDVTSTSIGRFSLLDDFVSFGLIGIVLNAPPNKIHKEYLSLFIITFF